MNANLKINLTSRDYNSSINKEKYLRDPRSPRFLDLSGRFETSLAYGIGLFMIATGCFVAGQWSTSLKQRKVDVYTQATDHVSMEPLLVGAIIFIGLAYLYCAHKNVSGVKQYVKNGIDLSNQYEINGDYSRALTVVENCQTLLKNSSLSPLEVTLSKTASLLESKVLNFGYSHLLFDSQYCPQSELLQLLEYLGMPSFNDTELAILQINQWAQENLKNRKNQLSRFDVLKETVLPLLKNVGYLDQSHAHFDTYEGAILSGGTLEDARIQLCLLAKQWNNGIKFQNIHFLTSDRTLKDQEKDQLINDKRIRKVTEYIKNAKRWGRPQTWSSRRVPSCSYILPEQDGWQPKMGLPTTESEIPQFIWGQSDIPREMRSIKLKKGSPQEWKNTTPARGRYLMISNFPHTISQDLKLRAFAPVGCTFDSIGPSYHQENIGAILDDVAQSINECARAWKRSNELI